MIIGSGREINKKCVPLQDLLKRLELLELKAENIELKFNQLEKLVITLDKTSET